MADIGPEDVSGIERALQGMDDAVIDDLTDYFATTTKAVNKLKQLATRLDRAEGGHRTSPIAHRLRSIPERRSAAASRELGEIVRKEVRRRDEAKRAAEEEARRHITDEDLEGMSPELLELLDRILNGSFETPRSRWAVVPLIYEAGRRLMADPWNKLRKFAEESSDESMANAAQLIGARARPPKRSGKRSRS
jgi:hypothetical protein